MTRRQVSVLVSAVLLAASVVAYLALRGSTRAQAQGADDPPAGTGEAEPVTETAEPNPSIEPGAGAPPHDPFTLYPADEGAVTWGDMTPEEQAGTEAMQEWAETKNGAEVHGAFAAAVGTTNNMRQLEAAQAASGLDGIETLGVVVP